MLGAMSIDDDPDGARLAAIERDLAQLVRLSSERRHRDKRDGRAILGVRIGDELAALVRRTARQRGCTISDLLRPAILNAVAVNQPLTEHLTELPSERGVHMRPRTLAAPRDQFGRDRSRQSISDNLAEQARLAAAGAATMAGRQARDGRLTEPGMLKELPGFGSRRPR
jgi:hypothetical protein